MTDLKPGDRIKYRGETGTVVFIARTKVWFHCETGGYHCAPIADVERLEPA